MMPCPGKKKGRCRKGKAMKAIYIYDTEREALEKKSDECGLSIAEIIEQLCDNYLDEIE